MSVTIKFRRGTASDWISNGSVVLASGEPGYEFDTGRLKIGDGTTAWSGLAYASIVPSGFIAGSGISINLGPNGSYATISASGGANIYNYGDNRVLTSDGTTTGINAENNLTFDGTTLLVNGTGVSVSGHTHTTSSITDFNSSVSGLLPVKNIVAGTGISISSITGVYTITSTGSGVLADQSSSVVTTVFNNTGSLIPKMSAVYINGGQGDQPTVQLAIATGDATSAGTYGVTYEAISNMSLGKVVVIGALTGVNTDPANGGIAGATEGSVLYLSPTTSGLLTTTKPSAPNHIVTIGNVVRVHQNAGVIEVRIVNGFELEELHNVAISGATNGQFLQYNSGTELWVPSSSGNFTTLQLNGNTVSVTGHTHTSSDITNFNSSVSGLLPTIANSGDNRILTSTGSSVGINAESNLTFNGTTLAVTGVIDIDNLRMDANTISSTNSNGNIVLAPNGTGDVQVDSDTLRVGDSNAAVTITTNGTGNLTLSTNGGTNSGTIVINQGSDANIALTPNGNGDIYLQSDSIYVGDNNVDAVITTNGTGNLTLNTNAGTNSGSITIEDGVDGNIVLVPNGTGKVGIANSGPSYTLDVTGGGKFTQLYPTVVDNGSVSGSVGTDVSTGQIFDMVLTGSTTLSNPTNAVDGVTVRWRITQDGTGGHSVSLDTEFQIPSSASSPLPWSTAANATDILAATYHAGRGKWDIVAFVPGY